VALAEIDDHARVGVFAEEIPVFRFKFLHRPFEYAFEQFGGGFFGLGDVGGHFLARDDCLAGLGNERGC